MSTEAFSALSGRLCPWLAEPLQSLESAWSLQRLGHAWLITGPTGLGKLNLALVFADRLLRGNVGREPPPELGPQEAVAAMRDRHAATDHHPDLHWLHPEEEKRTISVEQVRDATEVLGLKGFQGSTKIVVIEPAEAMTVAAANALLKSLEEPTSGTYMLLISHQRGRLPSTIRSRCQTLLVPRPDASTLAAWFGTASAEPGSSSDFGPGPIVAAQRLDPNYDKLIKELETSINLVCEARTDPQAVADEWYKHDTGAALDWLIARLQRAIRTRIGGRGSNPVTDPARPLLHNGFHALTLGALFEQLQSAERLREQLGGGINVELALRVLLLGFTRDRGRL